MCDYASGSNEGSLSDVYTPQAAGEPTSYYKDVELTLKSFRAL